MIELAWPQMLAALPLPLLARWLPPHRGGAALRVPFAADLAPAASSAAARRGALVLPWLIWLLLVVAAARPQWVGEPVALPAEGRDLMLAVDLSGSMSTADMVLDGRPVDRLTAVKAVAGAFIERRAGDQLGLILFGDRAYLQTPLTFDRRTVRHMLEEAVVGLAGQKTAIGDAIGLAVKRLRQRPERSRVVILLTDGRNTAGAIDPLQAAQLAAEAGVRIHTIGVGADRVTLRTPLGPRTVPASGDLDERSLLRIAELTDGAYFRARDREALERIYARIDELEPVESEGETFRPVEPLFHYPLAAALVLSALMALWRLWPGRSRG